MLIKTKSKKSLASQCRHYVTIQERTFESDNEGGQIETWSDVSDYVSVPASIIPLSASRKEQYRTFDVEASHDILFRGEIDIVEKNNRIVYGSRIFEVKSVQDIQERTIEHLVVCLERRD